MKNKLLLLLMWSSLGAFAQTPPDSLAPFKEKADYLLAPLMQGGVVSGILLDRVFPASGIAGWSANSIVHDTATGSKMIQALYEMEEAKLNPDPALPHHLFISSYRQQVKDYILPTGLLRMEVQVVDSNHLYDSSLIISEGEQLIYRGSGSPFETRHLRMASFLNPEPLQAGETYQVEYPQVFTNVDRGDELAYVKFRPQGGAWQTLLPGQTVPISFAASGSYFYEMEIGWADGTTLSNPVQVTVTSSCTDAVEENRPDNCAYWAQHLPYQANCGNQGIAIEADIAFQNVKGKGEVYYYRRAGVSSCDFGATPFRNPVIFIDGIDFEDERKGQAIYGKYLRYKKTNGDNEFVGELLRGGGSDLLILNFPDGTIKQFLNIPLPNPDVLAGKANAGIDGGCDYIERNAMTLVKLIQQVRNNLAAYGNSADKITIIGPSMGGLIARYALAYMEKNVATTGPHSCKLYISQDAPHLGANIPIGIQLLVRNIADGFGIALGLDFMKRRINVPATRQLLISHVEGSDFGAHALRQQFIQNQYANGPVGKLGWPMDPALRKVALHNGSMDGRLAFSTPPERVEAGGPAFVMSARPRAWLVGTLLASGPIPFSYLASKLRSKWEVFYSPAGNQTATVFKQSWYSETPLGTVYWQKPVRREIKAFNSGVSIDAAPGGLYDGPKQMYEKALEGAGDIWEWFTSLNIESHKELNSFIPLKSALAYHWNYEGLAEGGSGTVANLAEPLNNRNLVCTGEIPFNDYFQFKYPQYEPHPEYKENTQHIKLHPWSAAFITNQISPTPEPPVQYGVAIEGPRGVQNGSATKFKVHYQGNFNFITTWQLVEVSGISAILTDANLPTCKVQTGFGTNGPDGYFVLKAITSIELSTGEVVCGGELFHKVYVRKLLNMGNAECMCNLISSNYPVKVRAGKPSTQTQPNGVTYFGALWQISKWDEDPYYQQYAWPQGDNQWSFKILNISDQVVASHTYVRGQISFLGGLSPSSGATVYSQVRGVFRMPDPDHQGQFIEFLSAAKKATCNFTIFSGATNCQGNLIVSPNPVSHSAPSVTIDFEGEEHSNTSHVEILDYRGRSILEFEPQFPIVLDPALLRPGSYTVKWETANGPIESGLFVFGEDGSELSVSPNPSIAGIDHSAEIRLLTNEPVPESVHYRLEDFFGAELLSWEGSDVSLLPLDGLSPGTYVLKAQYGDTTVQNDVDFLLRGMPYLTVSPNPGSGMVTAKLNNSIYPLEDEGLGNGYSGTNSLEFSSPIPITNALSYTVSQAGLVLFDGISSSSEFQIALESYPPGIYTLTVSDGMAQYFKHILVVHQF